MDVLLVEDDAALSMGIEYSLKSEGFNVYKASSVKSAEKLYAERKYNIILLDVMLQDGNGYDICKKIRKKDDTPIIFLTACDEEFNVVMGLDMGADDYLTKPIRIKELIARINAVIRRKGKSNEMDSKKIESRDFTIYPMKFEVYKNSQKIELTSIEYKLLMLLIKNQSIVLTRDKILEKLWDYEENFIETNTLNVYIRRLRIKLKENPDNRYIETVRGIGYKWIGDDK
ncbi:response regulator transcription factor [Clostridium sp. BJN0001]|uniref:response regulator transcription factor n=1 Tax=Clostridium sp. BJN0001 TaxID=2930219 RepID=UPI001FD200F9|nr:response regulator transcription factor [Clostridium sp. BJN0001]